MKWTDEDGVSHELPIEPSTVTSEEMTFAYPDGLRDVADSTTLTFVFTLSGTTLTASATLIPGH